MLKVDLHAAKAEIAQNSQEAVVKLETLADQGNKKYNLLKVKTDKIRELAQKYKSQAQEQANQIEQMETQLAQQKADLDTAGKQSEVKYVQTDPGDTNPTIAELETNKRYNYYFRQGSA